MPAQIFECFVRERTGKGQRSFSCSFYFYLRGMSVILLLGTNLGDRLLQLAKCREEIEMRIGEIIKTSAVYETEAWGNAAQPSFYNQALEARCGDSPVGLLEKILDVEKQMGRIRLEKWGARSIDVDILYMEEQVVSLPHLVIPHPLLAERRFALTPLAEQWPDFVHPVLKKTNRELEAICKDTLRCARIDKGI